MKISEIIKQPEGRRLEFKETVPASADLAKTIVAFANDAGGELILGIYNDAWQGNWGFSPIDRDEFFYLANHFIKPILDPRLCLIAEVKGRPAGFGLALPDVNQVLKRISSGELWPSGWLKLLWFLKGPGRRSALTHLRLVTLGIKREFQNLALGPLLYSEYYQRGLKLGYHSGEASWVLEDNVPMLKALQRMNFKIEKIYRIYERKLG